MKETEKDADFLKWRAEQDINPIEAQIKIVGKPRKNTFIISTPTGIDMPLSEKRSSNLILLRDTTTSEERFVPFEKLAKMPGINTDDFKKIDETTLLHEGEPSDTSNGRLTILKNAKKVKTTRKVG